MGEGAVLKRRTVKQQSGASKSTLVFTSRAARGGAGSFKR